VRPPRALPWFRCGGRFSWCSGFFREVDYQQHTLSNFLFLSWSRCKWVCFFVSKLWHVLRNALRRQSIPQGMRSIFRFAVRARSRPHHQVFGPPVAHFAAFCALFAMRTLPRPKCDFLGGKNLSIVRIPGFHIPRVQRFCEADSCSFQSFFQVSRFVCLLLCSKAKAAVKSMEPILQRKFYVQGLPCKSGNLIILGT
jgi:hypothetical protein